MALAVRRGRPPACFCLLFARAKRRSPQGETLRVPEGGTASSGRKGPALALASKRTGVGKSRSSGTQSLKQVKGPSPWPSAARRLRASSYHAAPAHDARLPSVSGLKQDNYVVLGSSPSLRSIRAAHDGLALGKETVSDRQRKALSGPSVRPIHRPARKIRTHEAPLSARRSMVLCFGAGRLPDSA